MRTIREAVARARHGIPPDDPREVHPCGGVVPGYLGRGSRPCKSLAAVERAGLWYCDLCDPYREPSECERRAAAGLDPWDDEEARFG